eukprot:scaffold216337_cov63-Cyclotella_meneghiniana.AAC.1
MNGWRKQRLVYGMRNGHHNVFSNHDWGQSQLGPCPLFTPRMLSIAYEGQDIQFTASQPFQCLI